MAQALAETCGPGDEIKGGEVGALSELNRATNHLPSKPATSIFGGSLRLRRVLLSDMLPVGHLAWAKAIPAALTKALASPLAKANERRRRRAVTA